MAEIDRDTWQTPKALWDQLNTEYSFDFDCCASKENAKTIYFSANFEKVPESFLNNRVCWINPPFSKPIKMFTHFFNVVKKGVGIYRADNFETKVWQDIILKHADWIFIFDKRIQYEGFEGKGARFPSALFGVGVPRPNRTDGKVLMLK